MLLTAGALITSKCPEMFWPEIAVFYTKTIEILHEESLDAYLRAGNRGWHAFVARELWSTLDSQKPGKADSKTLL